MGESEGHMRLVRELVLWVARDYFGGETGQLLVDTPGTNSFSKPPRLNGFVPDLYARDGKDKQLIIGEAKTARDLENNHTRDQLSAFLTGCMQCDDALLVLAVPWHVERLARNLLMKIQRDVEAQTVSVVVLEQLLG